MITQFISWVSVERAVFSISIAGLRIFIVSLINEDLHTGVVKFSKAELSRRQMRHWICFVDDSDQIDLLFNLLNEFLVADPWLAVGVE